MCTLGPQAGYAQKEQHWSEIHRKNYLNCYIYFVGKSDDTTMDFLAQCTQWVHDKKITVPLPFCDHGLNQISGNIPPC